MKANGYLDVEFEAITLRMPGGTRYTCDWSAQQPIGWARIPMWEVKGLMREAARVRLKEFAAHFKSRFVFFLVRREGLSGWKITQV